LSTTENQLIVHVDMDAFYAAVEQLDDPRLAGAAVIVGGLGPRGVVATASYEARKSGVHSAMPMGRARRLCPHAHFIRPRMSRYREKSGEVFSVFESFTPLVEGLSLDEAFLDVTASLKLFGGALTLAQRIKDRVASETGLTASVGVAHNKFLAKLASDARKPDGLLWVRSSEVRAFLDPMPVSALWGIGRRTTPRLKTQGILTIGQLRRADPSVLHPVLGNRAAHFQALARGEDGRRVEPFREDKSLSHEVTFDTDLTIREELMAELQRQVEAVAARSRGEGLTARTVVVKIRDRDFRTVTRSRSLRAGSDSTRTIYRMARALFDKWRDEHRNTPVRLLGVGVTLLEPAGSDPEARADRPDGRADRGLDCVADEINRRFDGTARLVHAQTLKRRKPRPR
jgi:DNA polymerase-4